MKITPKIIDIKPLCLKNLEQQKKAQSELKNKREERWFSYLERDKAKAQTKEAKRNIMLSLQKIDDMIENEVDYQIEKKHGLHV